MNDDVKPTVEQALAGVFEQSAHRLALSGDLDFDENGHVNGANFQLTWNEQRDTPPVQEYLPP